MITNPNFVLVKDNRFLILINSENLTAEKLINSQNAGLSCVQSCMLQSIEQGELYIYDLRKDHETKEKTLVKIRIISD